MPEDLRSPLLTAKWEEKLTKIAKNQMKDGAFKQEMRTYATSLVEAVKNSAKNAGAHAMVISVPTPGGVGKAADPDLPVDALSAALLCADVWIEFNHQWLLYSTPFERAEAENKKMRYMCLVDFNPDLMIRMQKIFRV